MHTHTHTHTHTHAHAHTRTHMHTHTLMLSMTHIHIAECKLQFFLKQLLGCSELFFAVGQMIKLNACFSRAHTVSLCGAALLKAERLPAAVTLADNMRAGGCQLHG